MTDKKLIIVLSFHLSDVVTKGELIARYFNPGNLFDEVHFLLTNQDRPTGAELQASVGRARYFVHNLPMPSALATLGWQLPLLRPWVAGAVELVRLLRPNVIRSYGNFQSGYLATQVADRLGLPSVVSLHTHPADNRHEMSWLQQPAKRLGLQLLKKFERPSLQKASRVIIVYEAQREYAQNLGAEDIRCIYNLVNPSEIRVKSNYALSTPPRIISVGRQFERKNPHNIIRAIVPLKAELTLVGDGPLHIELVAIATGLGLKDRVHFVPAMLNDELCRILPQFDIFAVHWTTLGIPKSVIEPLLTGLPVVVNKDRSSPIPEIDGDWVMQVPDTSEGYKAAFKALLDNEGQRAELGAKGRTFAQANFNPQQVERQLTQMYSELL